MTRSGGSLILVSSRYIAWLPPFTTAFQTAGAACVTDIIHEGSARRVPFAEEVGCLPVERNLGN